ncbi:MAG: bifunctional phosphoglucose/phosphomannose isomerase [Chloroflexi bacterium]|nr:bifunctional phosphoglucose/phosphomannose isomerase [Chloroflexota bacterium]
MPAVNLDSPALYARLDPTAMRERLRGLAGQCLAAYREAQARALPEAYRTAQHVVVAGMGGSAIGGDLLAGLSLVEGGAVPITTWRDYGLPPWVGPRVLVVASSYSGETEETLSAFGEALRRGALALAITSGGRLKAMAEEHRVPVLTVPYRGEPRTALGYSFLAPLGILRHLGLVPDQDTAVQEACRLLERLAVELGEQVPEATNPAKALARRLWGRLPVVYGSGFLAGVALRWKTELNENAKTWAVAEVLPEVNHNASTAYGLPAAVRQHALVVLLRSGLLPKETLLRYRLTAELLAEARVASTVVESQGDSALAHILSAAYLGSWASYYLAVLYRVDPSPVPGIVRLKEMLRRAEGSASPSP